MGSDPQLNLLAGLCTPCPALTWCSRTVQQQCRIPGTPARQERFWQSLRRQAFIAGGVQPQALPPVTSAPALPRFLYIQQPERGHLRHGSDEMPVGIYGRRLITLNDPGCPIRRELLSKHGLSTRKLSLVLSGDDTWLRIFLSRLGPEFFRTACEIEFQGIIGPNLSAYGHSEHRVWLLNRAVCQAFQREMLLHGLPAILHTYLEDAPEHIQWLTEYLQLNPTQEYIATGFDHDADNDAAFVERRIEILLEIQRRVHRPLNVAFGGLMTRVALIDKASDAFPGRTHFYASSIYNRSRKGGSVLRADNLSRRFSWHDRMIDRANDIDLCMDNFRVHASMWQSFS
jgi:hypothetical protein